MKLYSLKTKGVGFYYIYANDPTEAENILSSFLNKADYGFSKDRIIESIDFIAEDIKYYHDNKPVFSSDMPIIINIFNDKQEQTK